MYLLKKKIKW